jgi:hypothetical protein
MALYMISNAKWQQATLARGLTRLEGLDAPYVHRAVGRALGAIGRTCRFCTGDWSVPKTRASHARYLYLGRPAPLVVPKAVRAPAHLNELLDSGDRVPSRPASQSKFQTFDFKAKSQKYRHCID